MMRKERKTFYFQLGIVLIGLLLCIPTGLSMHSRTLQNSQPIVLNMIQEQTITDFSTFEPGDCNCDEDIDHEDLDTLLDNYHTGDEATWSMGDFDGDTDVDIYDLAALLGNYGFSPGDLDHDHDVDDDDYNVFLATYGLCEGDPDFNDCADYDGDGCITLADYQCWVEYLRNWAS